MGQGSPPVRPSWIFRDENKRSLVLRNLLRLGILLLLGGGGGYLLSQYEIDGWQKIRLVPRQPKETDSAASTKNVIDEVPIQRAGDTIRIASFNVQVLGLSKMRKSHVVDQIARICRQFDVIAVQDIRSANQDTIPRLLDVINATGRHYDYVIGPRLPFHEHESNRSQCAFLFDRGSLEIDRLQLYTIDDPDNLLTREPLVGWFRVRGPPPEEAFTFSLVNVHVDPDRTADELVQLAKVYRAVRNDGRDEDDVILLGDFNGDDRVLSRHMRIAGLQWAISGIPTNTRGTHQYDNILFQQHATTEYVGRSGVYDFMRELNLTLDEALEVSDHLPVWAEFSVYEGGRPGSVALQPSRTQR
jgi:deoxyribonuclease-1-like protein